jgi:microcystin-dependent protein
MASVFRYFENPIAHQYGDTKMSSLDFDHAGWLICDGRLLDKERYNHLYGVIGGAFGVSGETHFRLPDPAGRVPAVVGQAAPGMNTWVMGDISGEEKHQLTIAEMPAHKHGSVDVTGNTNGNGSTTTNGLHAHNITDEGHSHSYVKNTNDQNTDNAFASETAADQADLPGTTGVSTTGIIINQDGSHNHSMGSTGGSQAHNTIQPTIYVGNMFIYGGF